MVIEIAERSVAKFFALEPRMVGTDVIDSNHKMSRTIRKNVRVLQNFRAVNDNTDADRRVRCFPDDAISFAYGPRVCSCGNIQRSVWETLPGQIKTGVSRKSIGNVERIPVGVFSYSCPKLT